LTDRIEFRWNAGTYDFRYRNRLTIDRPFKIKKLRFSPYAAGELFWDRNHHYGTKTSTRSECRALQKDFHAEHLLHAAELHHL
jgi:hypothetical protein